MSYLPDRVPDGKAVIVGRMMALQLATGAVIPNISIVNAAGERVVTVHNATSFAGKSADRELTFWAVVDPGRHQLHEYWWAGAIKRGRFAGPINFEAEAGKINYIGDVLFNAFTGYNSVAVEIDSVADGSAVVAQQQQPLFGQLGLPVATRLLHE